MNASKTIKSPRRRPLNSQLFPSPSAHRSASSLYAGAARVGRGSLRSKALDTVDCVADLRLRDFAFLAVAQLVLWGHTALVNIGVSLLLPLDAARPDN